MIAVRTRLELELHAIGEHFDEIETFGIPEHKLDKDVDDLDVGGAVAWTKGRVYFIADYVEGFGNVLTSAPRNPGDYLPGWELLGEPRFPDERIWPDAELEVKA